ncbi:MAG: PIN domain-containing protein [Actinobacteria bacterium]|nr:PIN domain-containing protein [Actinomycetota bacterium]
MSVLVDTSVWSLAFRRDASEAAPEAAVLRRLLEGRDLVVTTGLVLQELLQGFAGARARAAIVSRFGALPFLSPSRGDHVAAADLRTTCRRAGVQLGTIDALVAALCIRNDLTLLTADGDFLHAAGVVPLRLFHA